MIYLDNAATTKPCAEAVSAAVSMMEKTWHNPSSLYKEGMFAADVIDAARESVAKLLSCREKNVFFTSGGTEANNLAVHSALLNTRHVGKKIIASAYEHSSIYENLLHLEKSGYRVVFIAPEKDGTISPDKVANEVDESTALVCVMLSNNEVGAVNDLERIVKLTKGKNPKTLVHTDAVALFGKMQINAERLNVDSLSFSAHKIHALKGCGGVYFKNPNTVKPLIVGGEQENRLRPGTENAPAIAALGAACEIARKNLKENYSLALECKKRLTELVSEREFVRINAENDFPFVTSISVDGIRSETLLHFLEKNGVLVSSGSACARGKKSHVLTSLSLDNAVIDSTIRVSLSHNTVGDIDALFDLISKAHETLVKR